MDDISPEHLVSEFLDSLRERADKFFKGHLHQAFIDWYVEAEFGELRWDFTDGPGDGGIDAVVWRRSDDRPSVIIIQSKFAERIGAHKVAKNAYTDFHRVVEAFYHRGEAFEDFLSTVPTHLRKIYRKASKLLDGNWLTQKKAFRLISTLGPVRRLEFARIPSDCFVYENDILGLYRQFRRDQTPKARELVLSVQDKLSYIDSKRRVTSYLFNARVSDFKKYLEQNDVARLVARNIRYELPGKIGGEIRKTYEKTPHDFWYLHNGITIVCDDFAERERKATLTNPSVINGAQTLYAINHSPLEYSQALVGTRVIVRGKHSDNPAEDDEWLQKIIRGVNTQNRVQESDFRSNEPEQILLQSKFRDLRVFYERKRGEWAEHKTDPKFKGFRRLSLRLLGQILTVASEADGDGVLLAKKGIDFIFEDRNYRDIFPSRPKVPYRFPKMYVSYRLFELLKNFGFKNAKEYRRRRHAFWNSLWVLQVGLTSHADLVPRTNLSLLKRTFDHLEKSKTARRTARVLTTTVWNAWRTTRREDPERWTPNNFFKAKYGNQRIKTLAFPKLRGQLRTLAREIIRARA